MHKLKLLEKQGALLDKAEQSLTDAGAQLKSSGAVSIIAQGFAEAKAAVGKLEEEACSKVRRSLDF